DQAAIIGIRLEAELLARNQRLMNFLQRTLGNEQAFLVIVAGIAELLAAAMTTPGLRRQIDVEILGDADFHDRGPRCTRALLWSSMAIRQPVWTKKVVWLDTTMAGPDSSCPARRSLRSYTGMAVAFFWPPS